MAKQSDDARTRNGSTFAQRTNGHARETDPVMERDDERDDELAREAEAAGDGDSAARPSGGYAAPTARPSAGFFDIYRPGQGGRVRMGTAVIAGLLVVWGAYFVVDKLSIIDSSATRMWLQIIFGAGLLLGGGIAVFRVLSQNRRAVDFLIATEGEMKKVNWSTRKEVIGSTKVVIFVMFAMALILFVVDFGLLEFFSKIGVLRLFKHDLSTLFGGS